MELPSVLTNWSAQTEYANENNVTFATVSTSCMGAFDVILVWSSLSNTGRG